MEDCLFCKIVKGLIPSKKVYEDEDVYAFNDINPQAPVHVLIVPKRHIDRFSSLGDEDGALAGKMVLASGKIARRMGFGESGYRIVGNCEKDAGQLVFHIHLHLLGGRKFNWPPG